MNQLSNFGDMSKYRTHMIAAGVAIGVAVVAILLSRI